MGKVIKSTAEVDTIKLVTNETSRNYTLRILKFASKGKIQYILGNQGGKKKEWGVKYKRNTDEDNYIGKPV